ncbi:ABC transporter ATP-binding protein YtrE [bacterium BMS3Bbin04]|nr:ABC transporter ATP-binding protein YtrE [bacterium BMS3Bbin04]
MKPLPAIHTKHSETPLVRVRNLVRTYRTGSRDVHALYDLDADLPQNGSLALVGRSGSGKSTLLNLLAGLDRPSSGTIEVNGQNLATFSRKELAAYRASEIGIIFQAFQLIPHRTALQNVELGLAFLGVDRAERLARATAMLERVGLGDRVHHKPDALSGGEKQRVAIARALVKKPRLLLADEPTGNLDRENTSEIADLLASTRESGISLVLVTHDHELAEATCDSMLHLEYGRVVQPGKAGS